MLPTINLIGDEPVVNYPPDSCIRHEASVI